MNSPQEISKNYLEIGKSKGDLSILKMLLLGVLAGMFIGFAAVGCIFGNAYVNKVMGAAIFPAGLCLVVIAGSELFTGNCLMIISVLSKKLSVSKMLRNWLFVYIGNFIGSIIVAFLAWQCGAFSAENVASALASTASAKVAMPFLSTFIKGILCNILVCLAV